VACPAPPLSLFPPRLDGPPRALFEAAAAGTPFISTDVGNSREIAEWTGAGLIAGGRTHETGMTFVDVADAARLVEQMYHDADRRRHMGARGRESVLEHYTWDKIVDRYEAVYRELVAGSSSRPV